MTNDEWLSAREVEINEFWELLGMRIVDDPLDGAEPPDGSETPSTIAEMLHCRTGIPGWRVWISAAKELEIAPPLRDQLTTDGTEGVL